jgi:hypothetical protein
VPGSSHTLKHPPPVALDASDARHANALAQLAKDRISKVDGEAHLKWLETGKGDDPCRGSSD